MLQSKKGNFIISLILAIALWMYVIGGLNPETTKSFHNVPITIVNQDILSEEGLTVASVGAEYISVTISGKRSVMSRIDEDDIRATVDVSRATQGENQLRIHLKVPGNAYVTEQSITEVTVRIEKLVTEERPVQVSFSGKREEGAEAEIIRVDPASVKVSGAKSKVDKVAFVEAPVKLGSVEERETTTESILIPMTKEGKTVKGVSLSAGKAEVTSVLHKTRKKDQEPKEEKKTLTLLPGDITLQGVPEGFTAEVTSGEIQVTLTGTGEALEDAGAGSLSAACDVSDLKEGEHKIPLKLTCALKGVKAEAQPPEVTVSLKVKSEE